MKILAEINDKTLGIGSAEQLGAAYTLRKSARAILLNENGEMAAQYLSTYDYYKLPGGGVEMGETLAEGLHREIMEEVGCECEILDELGVVIEYRDKYKMLHLSYGFTAKVIGVIGTPELEAGEIAEGQETIWLPPQTVRQKIQSAEPERYEAKFHLQRELAILNEYLKIS